MNEDGKEEIGEMDQAAMLVLVYEGGELSASPDQVWTKTEWESFYNDTRF